MVDDLRIDTDGKASDEMKRRNYYGDLDHAADNETSYFQDRIAADEIPYFVIPYKTKKQKEKFNKYGWSVGILINFDTNEFIYGVVADTNNKRKHNTVGEVSLYAVWNIQKKLKDKPDIQDIPTEGNYGIILYEKSAPKDKWNAVASQKPEIMRNKIYAQGRKCFTGDGKCLNKNKKLNKEKKVK